MAWEWRYQLERAPQAKTDGSGDIVHDIWAWGCEDGGEWANTGMHRDIPVPASEIQAALAAGNDSQIASAYIAALVSNAERTSSPVTGWTAGELESRMENNQAAASQAVLADVWILSVESDHQYPITGLVL